MKRLYASLLLIVFSMCGCMGLYRNYRVIEQDNIHAHGHRNFMESIRYSYIEFGTDIKPWDGLPHFTVMFPTNIAIQSSEFSVENISSINPDLLRIYSAEDEGWPKGSKRLYIYGCSFIYSSENQLLSFRTQIRNGKSLIKLGKADDSEYYRLPLTETQMHILFGTNFTVTIYDFRL